MTVYITHTGAYLPGAPVTNDAIENHLGLVHGKPSRYKKRVLNSNGIRTRHYAIDAAGRTLSSNAQMAAQAAKACLAKAGLDQRRIGLLSCATSQGDLVLPGFASMVQAEMQLANVEIHNCHGICSSGMMALKAAFTSLACKEHHYALVVASELASRLFKASRYEALAREQELDFNSEFLRWMLSDGAGAWLLAEGEAALAFPGVKLQIDWIRGFSHADAYPVCMSVGRANDSELTWQDYPTYAAAEAAGALLIRQDVRLLDAVVKNGVDGYLRLIEQGRLEPQRIDHVLCHYSSHHFRGRIFELLRTAGVMIDEPKWYTNLYERGNTGCASLFIMLDEFLRAKPLNAGEKILCMVPESGRFNSVFMGLTVAAI